PAKLAVERGALARRLGGTLFGFGHALRLGFQRLLAGDPRLELHGRGGLGGGELLGDAPAFFLGRKARRELGLGTCERLGAAARDTRCFVLGRRARQRGDALHLGGGAPLLRRLHGRLVRFFRLVRALCGRLVRACALVRGAGRRLFRRRAQGRLGERALALGKRESALAEAALRAA